MKNRRQPKLKTTEGNSRNFCVPVKKNSLTVASSFQNNSFLSAKRFFLLKTDCIYHAKKKTSTSIILLKLLPAKKKIQSSEKIFLQKKSDWIIHCEKNKKKKGFEQKKKPKKRVDIFSFMRLNSTTCWTLLQWIRKRKGFTEVRSKRIPRLWKSFQK